jgi:Listeria-Bacteroides repeat domain (List_Bact_rpt).
MRTKFYLLLIALVATVGSVWGQAVGDSFLYNGLKYEITDDTLSSLEVKVVQNAYQHSTIVVPVSAINPNDGESYKVTGVGVVAFANCNNLVSVELPETVERIESYVFANSPLLATVTLPTTVESMEDGVFLLCLSLKSVTLPKGVTSFGSQFFEGSGITSLKIPASVSSIHPGAFLDCKALASITVAAGGSSFSDENGVLYNFDKTRVVLYPSAKIDATEFVMPPSVAGIYFTNNYHATFDNKTLEKITGGTISNIEIREGVLYSATGTKTLLFCPMGRTGEFAVPADVTALSPTAFKHGNLEKIEIHKDVATIGTAGNEGDVFSYGSNLTEIVVAAENTKYYTEGGLLFDSSAKETLLAYPSGKQTPTTYSPDNTVTAIGGSAFAGNFYITSFVGSSTLEEIREDAFAYAKSLKTVTSIDAVKTIGARAFLESSLESINLPADNPDFKILNTSVFNFCQNLTSIEIPASVESIGVNAFNGCFNLSNVVLNEGLVTLGRQAFNSTAISSITIPSTVEEIAMLAFQFCNNLREVTFLHDDDDLSSLTIHNNTFIGISEDAYMIVPEDKRDAYVQWAADNHIPIFPAHIYERADVDVASDEPLKFIDKETGEVLSELPQANRGKEYTILPEDDEKYEVESLTVTDGGSTTSLTKGTDSEFHVVLDGNKEINVVVVPKKVVTFISDGNSILQYVKNGERATSPSISKQGYNLRGWNEAGSTALWNFSTSITADLTLTVRWTEILDKYTVTITPLVGVTVDKAGGEVEAGYNYSFTATADARGNRVIVYVNGEELKPASDNFYLIEGIIENKTVTFRLTTGAYAEDSIVGEITINGEPLNDKKTDFPTSGKIVITFNEDADTNVSGKVIVDGKEVPGTWGKDSNGNPTYTIDYSVEGDGEHTIKIEGFGGDGETHTFVTGGGNGNNGSDDNKGGGKVVIDDNTPLVIPGEFLGDGEIVVYPPVVTYPEIPKVTIDGEEVVPGGTWDEDENGDPIFVIEYEGLEDGEHTIVVNGKEYTFTVKNGSGATSNDVLSATKVVAGHGTISVSVAQPTLVQIVSMSGAVVYSANVAIETVVSLPQGLYIVKAGVSGVKVVVR